MIGPFDDGCKCGGSEGSEPAVIPEWDDIELGLEMWDTEMSITIPSKYKQTMIQRAVHEMKSVQHEEAEVIKLMGRLKNRKSNGEQPVNCFRKSRGSHRISKKRGDSLPVNLYL